jgi:hypothetical protein
LFVVFFPGYKTAVLGCIYSLLLVTQVRNFREPVAIFLAAKFFFAVTPAPDVYRWKLNNNEKSG